MLNCSPCPCERVCPKCGGKGTVPIHPAPWHPYPDWWHRVEPWYIEPNVGSPYNPTRPWPGRTLEVWS